MSYVGVPPFGQTVQTVTEKIAIAGQTTFSPDGGYMPGYVDVLINGTELASSDYTATNGTTIVLNTACAAGEEFKCKARWPVSMVDTYRKGEVDSLLSGKLNDAAGVVTYAKMQSVTAGKVLGRDTSGAGTVQELPIAVDTYGNVGIGRNPIRKLDIAANTACEFVVAQADAKTDGKNWNLLVDGGGVSTNSNFTLRLLNDAGNAAPLTGFTINGTTGQMSTPIGFGSAVYPAFMCRAWVNYNSISSVISASGNISSVTKNATGIITVNFAVAMPDTLYSVSGMSKDTDASYGTLAWIGMAGPGTGYETYSTTQATFVNQYGPANATYDSARYCLQFFR